MLQFDTFGHLQRCLAEFRNGVFLRGSTFIRSKVHWEHTSDKEADLRQNLQLQAFSATTVVIRSTGQLGRFSALVLPPHLPLNGASRAWTRGSGGSSASALTGGEWQAHLNSLTLPV
eukprot:870749-Rhodomonas_salina.1